MVYSIDEKPTATWSSSPTLYFLLTEAGDYVLHETGDKIIAGGYPLTAWDKVSKQAADWDKVSKP